MITKCPECGNDISDKAYTCPHCGCPLLMDKITAKARIRAQEAAARFSCASQRAKIKASSIALLTFKSLAVVIAIACSYFLISYLAYIPPANMGLRIFINVFSTFIWAPVFLITRRFFGRRTYIIIYMALMIIITFLIFGESSILKRESLFYKITSDQYLYAIVGKIVGVLWLGIVLRPRGKSLNNNIIDPDALEGRV